MATVAEEPSNEKQKAQKSLPYWYVFLTVIVAMVVMAIAGVVYTNYVDRKNASGWCDLIVFYTDYYRDHPPQTDLQRRQYALMDKRRMDLDCK